MVFRREGSRFPLKIFPGRELGQAHAELQKKTTNRPARFLAGVATFPADGERSGGPLLFLGSLGSISGRIDFDVART